MINVRSPIGTNADGARKYLGITRTRFDALRRLGVIKPLGRDWYSFADLDEAMSTLRSRRELSTLGDDENEDAESTRSKAPTGDVVREGNRSNHVKTQELLREIAGRGHSKGRGVSQNRSRPRT